MISRIAYVKEGNGWRESFVETDPAAVYEWLARELVSKKINECRYITRITRHCNYNGTQSITIYYTNGVKNVYTVKN